MIKITGSSR